jgi:hypothetical protein|tara:strand:- start:8727 stop:8906 length:180 start_codon:yes stop_codon:yes gene_type:complete
MKTIEVVIDESGVVVSTSGFAGGECKKETADLERALGKTTNDTKTAEFHKPVLNKLKAR